MIVLLRYMVLRAITSSRQHHVIHDAMSLIWLVLSCETQFRYGLSGVEHDLRRRPSVASLPCRLGPLFLRAQ